MSKWMWMSASVAAMVAGSPAMAQRLGVGDPAPKLDIATWVKGEPVESFKEGHVYVVEFWATWCGPCIAGIPHLSELQAEYKDKATIIGVNIWERDKSQDERNTRVGQWVTGREDMNYTVAIENGNAMADAYMKAAGRNGIPSAFIVGGDGKIAWIGHPGQMDAPLAAAVKLVSGQPSASEADDKPVILSAPEVALPEVLPGAKAPKLELASFASGESFDEFKEGEVYVVEFWATWCGPCIAGIPHLAELQAKYDELAKDDPSKKVTIVGVNIWEQDEGQERADRVTKWVVDRADMKYTVAIEKDTLMADTWMKPAGQNGIPAAFIVNQKGEIAWIGHPMTMDEPLEQVVNGTFDVAVGREQAIAAAKSEAWIGVLMDAVEQEKFSSVYATVLHHLKDEFAEQSGLLNWLAWNSLTEEGWKKDTKFAIAAAKQACDATEWKDASIIDTLARGYWEEGKKERSIELQRKAIEVADDEMRPSLQDTLDEYLKDSGN